MIGTSISMQNSNLMLFPSITVCRQPGIAHYKDGDMLEAGSLYYKDTTNTTNPYSLAHTPDLSDLLAQIKTKHGSNGTTLKINSTDVENRNCTLIFDRLSFCIPPCFALPVS